MDIEDIKKFSNDPAAWYLVTVPAGTRNDKLMSIKGILDDCRIKGTFMLVTADMTIEDITDHIKEMIKHG